MYNQIFSQKYDDTIFLASGCKSSVQKYSSIALTILNRAFSDVEIVAIIDRDDQLEEIKDSNIKIRMLKRREFENYLLDMEIVEKLAPTINKEKYKKLVSDIINDDVKSKIKEIKQLCGYDKPDSNFKDDLSNCISEDTQVFKELEACIFE